MVKQHPLDHLPNQLWLASQQAARRAVLRYREDDSFERIQAAVNMGLAAEVLLMATVASIDTSLLADRNSPQSKLALTRRGNPTGRLLPSDLRTISWDEAHKLMAAHDEKLKALEPPFRRVMSTRNAAAHAGLTDEDDLGTAVIALVKIAEALHTHLEFELDDYWGPKVQPMVTEILDKMTNAVRQSKIAKIINAEKSYGQICERFSGVSLQAYIKTSLERPLPQFADGWSGDYQFVEDYRCPACNNAAHVFYLGTDNGEFQSGYDDVLREEYVKVFIDWVPWAFECQVCNLTLSADEAELLDDVEPFEDERRFTRNDTEGQRLFDLILLDPETMFMDLD